MGNDGGSIPKRGDMVRTQSKAVHLDKDSLNYERWNLCAISMEPLEKPIVACRLGRLYNKEAVMYLLLDRTNSDYPPAFAHLTSLKDVKELNVKMNTSAVKGDSTGSRMLCPVTGNELNGKSRAFYYRSCGCVLSGQALSSSEQKNLTSCVNCGKEITQEDRVQLNGSAEEVEAMKAKLALEKGLKKKKPVKRKIAAPVEEDEPAGPRRLPAPTEILALKRNKNIDELYIKR